MAGTEERQRSVREQFQITSVHLNGNTLHNQIQGEDYMHTSFQAHNNTFHPGQGARTDASLLTDSQQRMRFCPPLCQARSQALDIEVHQPRGFPARSSHHAEHPGNFKHADSLPALDSRKDIAGKQRHLQFYFGAIIPASLRPKNGKKAFHAP